MCTSGGHCSGWRPEVHTSHLSPRRRACVLHRRVAVKITLLTDDSLRLEPAPGMLTIEAPTASRSYSPFHMLASGLAMCTWSILQSWAENVKLGADPMDLVIEVSWTFVEEPHRIGAIALTFDWSSLPPARREAARRVAALCPIHTTLEHAPTITIAAAERAPLADARPAAAAAAGATASANGAAAAAPSRAPATSSSEARP